MLSAETADRALANAVGRSGTAVMMTGVRAGTAAGGASSTTGPVNLERDAARTTDGRATAASAEQHRAGGGAHYKYPRHFDNMVSTHDMHNNNIDKLHNEETKRRKPARSSNPALAGTLDDSWFENTMSHGEAIQRASKVKRNGPPTKRLRRATSVPVVVEVAEMTDTQDPLTSWPRSRDRLAPKPPKLTRAWVAAIQRESQSWDPGRRYGRASTRFVKQMDRWQTRLKKYFKHKCVNHPI